ncbi:unnamed protein product [Caenorhabditis nigoni]
MNRKDLEFSTEFRQTFSSPSRTGHPEEEITWKEHGIVLHHKIRIDGDSTIMDNGKPGNSRRMKEKEGSHRNNSVYK